MKYDDNYIYRAKLKTNINDEFKDGTFVFIDYGTRMDKFRILNFECYLNPEDVEILQEFCLIKK